MNRRPLQYITRAMKFLLLGTLFCASLLSVSHIKPEHYYPIRTVTIYGVHHIDKQEIQSILTPLVSHGFFAVNLEYIHDRLMQLPWLSDIYVRRIWPDQVEIKLVERNAVAKWNELSLLSDNGEIFNPDMQTYPDSLPTFAGPQGEQLVMLQYFTQINQLLVPLHAKIVNLELTPFMTWKVVLDNGITLNLGHKDILTRLAHFVKVYPKIIANHPGDVDYIDLRYPNGVAVKWKEAS